MYIGLTVGITLLALARHAREREPADPRSRPAGRHVGRARTRRRTSRAARSTAARHHRNRVDGLGVAEPEISRQGDNIVVDLPGVKDRDKARRIVGRTAELRFRPVLAELPPVGAKPSTTTTTGASSTTVARRVDVDAPTTTTTLPPEQAATPPRSRRATRPSSGRCSVGTKSRPPNSPTTSEARVSCCRCAAAEGRRGRLYLGPTKLTGKDVDNAKSRFAPAPATRST